MSVENMIETAVWIIGILLLYFGVPKKKYREAQVSFFIMQTLTWFFGGLVAEFNLVTYPVRFLNHAFRTSFTFEFFAFPVLSVLFNLYFPKNASWKKRGMYIFSFPSIMTFIEVLLEKYTDTIEYINWSWFFSWITILITLCISYLYYKWFFNRKVI